ncbi:MAG: PspC domain-containing protein [Candidatus Aminicenantales bacterium]
MKVRTTMNNQGTTCPYCCEEVSADALKCRWCGSTIRAWRAESNWSRDLPGRWLLGVANMLAHRTNLSVQIWRVLFVLSTFIYGIGPLLYLTIWALTPGKVNEEAPLKLGIQAFNDMIKDLAAKVR